MRFPSLFKTSQPKEFSITPRYYDERKERIEKKLRQAKKEIELSKNNETLEKGTFQSAWRQNKTHTERKKSNYRVLVIATILVLIFYFLLR
jgi:hypothetical protein